MIKSWSYVLSGQSFYKENLNCSVTVTHIAHNYSVYNTDVCIYNNNIFPHHAYSLILTHASIAPLNHTDKEITAIVQSVPLIISISIVIFSVILSNPFSVRRYGVVRVSYQ